MENATARAMIEAIKRLMENTTAMKPQVKRIVLMNPVSMDGRGHDQQVGNHGKKIKTSATGLFLCHIQVPKLTQELLN